jgi:hypothetical protein
MPSTKKLLQAAAGNAGESLYVEDVFSTYLYTGNSSTQTITNDIDLDGEGGMVWIKNRSGAGYEHEVSDTERGVIPTGRALNTNDNQANQPGDLTSFTSSGFGLSYNTANGNASGQDYVSWTFRKAEKFFDVVTYTGNGTATNNISHNLGDVPGFIVVKRTDSDGNWCVAAGDSSGNYKQLTLNNNGQSFVSTTKSNIADSSIFNAGYLGINFDGSANVSGGTYVAYLFASDAGGFGDDGSENIIKCGSFTNSGSSTATVNLGFEPQFLMVKSTVTAQNWFIFDNMRGMPWSSGANYLNPNTSAAETGAGPTFSLTATGFNLQGFIASEPYIYIAIRRPMKTPESGTEVFNPIAATSSPPTLTSTVGFPADLLLQGFRTYGLSPRTNTRLTGDSAYLETASTGSEQTGFGGEWDHQDDYVQSAGISTGIISWFFKRATGFFDVVAYTGTGVARTVNHNLAAVPDLMIFKQRDIGGYWMVYPVQLGNKYLVLQLTNAVANGFTGLWNNASPTASTFPLGTGSDCNQNGGTYVAYLFATLAGVSKVGSYTGTAADLNVDCGFSAGARFILIKRTDSTGDWYVWDSARGIVAGNDPYLLLNSTAAEVTSTDYIDPLSSGFTVTSSAPAALNASGGTYIFLAIA